MRRRRSAEDKAPPISLAVTKEQRERFDAEARRRGLGISTTIRTLALERADELREDRQHERALRWQTRRVRSLAGRIESEGFDEVGQAEIDAVFDDAARPARRSPRRPGP